MSWRGLVVGLLLSPLCVAWVVQCEVVWWNGFPSDPALPSHLVAILLFVVLLNVVVRRVAPRRALSAGDLCVAWIVMAVITGLCSMSQIPWLFPAMAHPFFYATGENRWQERLWPHLPTHLTVREPEVLSGFYLGDASLLQQGYLRAWLGPLAAWSLFLLVLFGVTLCIAAIFRRRWTEEERLAYPLLEIPLALMRRGGDLSLLRSTLFQVGAALAGGLCLYNGLAYLNPALPPLRTKVIEIGQFFPSSPWNAMGWTVMGFYPFAIGIAYFLPTDLAFSLWFFFIVRKLQPIAVAAFGYAGPDPTRRLEQNLGAVLGLFAMILWGAWPYLRKVVRTSGSEAGDEPLPYWLALAGILAGSVFLIYFAWAAGMALAIAVLYIVIYLAICTTITYLRAQVGPPVHQFYGIGPNHALVSALGPLSIPTSTLAVFPLFGFMNWLWSSHPMQQQLDSFRLADRVGLPRRSLTPLLLALLPVGLGLAFTFLLAFSYSQGNPSGWWARTGRTYMYNYFDAWAESRHGPDIVGTAFIGGSLVITLLLALARTRFVWWPLHPAGYALGMANGTDYVWMPVLIAWLVKVVLLRYGGLRMFRRGAPFFVGLVIGEYTVGSIWQLIGLALRQPMYGFWVF